MTVPAWRRYARFWGARVDADVDEELEFHLAMLARDYRDRGLTNDDARTAALLRLGDLPGARDACLTIGHRRQRRMARTQTIDAFVQDCRFALRTFGRAKGWTAVALVTLALGIGASTAMFSVINSLILHPLSYVGADRVVLVWMADPKSAVVVSPSEAIGKVWRRSARSFDAFEGYTTRSLTMTDRGEPVALESGMITSGFLDLAGARAVLGRAFLPDEDRPNSARVAMISEGLWKTRFGGSPNVLRERVTLDGTSYAIVGVAPASLRLPALTRGQIDIWTPMGADTASASFGLPVARLRPGVSRLAATRELDSLAARSGIKAALPGFRAQIVAPGDFVNYKASLYLLAGAVALLLLVACANVAHLLLARSVTRERELAIRSSLGASRVRLARQLLTESLLLAALGCAGGLVFGYAGVYGLLAIRPASMTELALAHLDARAVAIAIAIAVLTGVLFGLTTALHGVRRTASDSLRATSLTGTANRDRHRLRSILVVTEMAFSAILLVGAALLVRSVRNLQHVDPHFTATDLYALKVEMPANRYPTMAARSAYLKTLIERMRLLSAVDKASLAESVPPDGGYMLRSLEADNGNKLAGGQLTAMNTVSPEYFDVIGLRLVQGQTFSASPGPRDLIVNEGIARQLWPGESAVGKRVRFATAPGAAALPWNTVVGVAENMPVHGPSADPAAPMFYSPVTDSSGFISQPMRIAVRSRPGVDPTTALRSLVMSLDTHAAPPNIESVSNALRDSISRQRFTMNLLAVFAVLAVILSAVGLYGVISYAVTQRTREIGIRIALGAMPAQVARTIAARGLVLSTLGLGAGLGAAVWGTKLIKSTLFGVTGTDALSYVTTGVALLAISIVASVVPMRRAMRVDPVIAMRGD